MKVLKFGGTSVGSAARLRALPALLPADTPHVVVLSAMAGTTNALVHLAQLLYAGDQAAAAERLAALRAQYHAVAHELLPEAAVLAEALAALDARFDAIAALLPAPLTTAGEKIILAQGELLSTLLFHRYLTGILGQPAVLLPALDFMRLRPDQEPDADLIETQLTDLLSAHAGQQCFITQGYICRSHTGHIDNLKRGGSDYSATLIGAAIRASEVQIWTDIDGLHNNDPRVVEGTEPVRELSFDEAVELAYFGAKILHPSTVLPVRELGIPVRLLNTMQPDAPGTLISGRSRRTGIKAVAVKDGLTTINVRSNRSAAAYEFLPGVFDAFRRHRLPIDLVATAETAVGLTVEAPTDALAPVLDELRQLGPVAVRRELSVVCLVGQGLGDQAGPQHLFAALHDVRLHKISYGGSSNSVCLLIDSADKTRVLRLLHEQVFEQWAEVAELVA